MSHPTVSVIMPNYNHAKFLPHALAGILAQSYRPFEIIIIDDGSTDNSIEVLESFAEKHSLIQLFANEQNRGVVYTLNRGIDLAKGDYLLMAAADDYVLPEFLERSMKILACYPQAGLSICHSMVQKDSGEFVRQLSVFMANESCYFSSHELMELGRTKGFSVGNQVNGVVVKKKALTEIGAPGSYLIPSLKSACDFFAMNVIGFRYGVCYVPKSLAIFRKTTGSYSSSCKTFRDEVVKEIFDLLLSPKYCDVLSQFQKSGIIYYFETAVLRVVMTEFNKYRGFLNFSTLRIILLNVVREVVWGALPESLHDRYLAMKDKFLTSVSH